VFLLTPAMNHRLRSIGRLASPLSRYATPLARIASRVITVLLLWTVAVSGVVPDREAASMPARKDTRGKPSEAPIGSQWVQVREHRLRGVRVTEVVLGRASLDDELPMVVYLHGRGSRPELPKGDHEDTPPVRMVFPWAPDRLGDGYSWFPVSITEGYDPKVLGYHIQRRADQLAHVIKRLMYTRPTEGRALVAGFSQGGMLTFGLALHHPDLFDGAYPIAGWFPLHLVDSVIDPTRRYPEIRALHGDRDPVVPMRQTRAVVERLAALGLDATFDAHRARRHHTTDAMRERHKDFMLGIIRRRRQVELDLEATSTG
jgi:phospholipase/carboxylesterase